MSRNQKEQASNRPASTQNAKRQQPDPDKQRQEWEEQDEANKRRFVDQSGLAAQDLPEGAHGQNVVDHPSDTQRNLPHLHGGEVVSDPHAEGGTRGAREMSDADDHGGRKGN